MGTSNMSALNTAYWFTDGGCSELEKVLETLIAISWCCKIDFWKKIDSPGEIAAFKDFILADSLSSPGGKPNINMIGKS